MKEIRTVIWDCDGVIFFHKEEEQQILGKALGISDHQELRSEFFSMLEAFDKHFSNKKVVLSEYYKIIEQKMPILFFYGISPETFMEVYKEIKLLTIDFNNNVLSVMENLRQKGLKQIIRTDWWQEIQVGILKEYGVLNYIEKLYCCNDRYLKSNPLSASEIIKSGSEKENVIIGDTLSSDIAFASHSGIKSIWFNKDGKKQNDTKYKPDFEVQSLLEIMEII